MNKSKFILIFLLFLNACAINRAPSLNLLEKRSDYDGVNGLEDALNAVDNPLLVPVRTEPLVADVWVHPHELANGDYFRGAWIRTVVSRSSWQMDEKHESLIVKEKPTESTKIPKNRGDHGK